MNKKYLIAIVVLMTGSAALWNVKPEHVGAQASSEMRAAAAWLDVNDGILPAQTTDPVISSFTLQTNNYVGPCPAKINASAQIIVPNGANFQYNWSLGSDHGATLSKYTGDIQHNTFLQTTINVPANYSKTTTELELQVADKKHQVKASGTFTVTCTLPRRD